MRSVETEKCLMVVVKMKESIKELNVFHITTLHGVDRDYNYLLTET